MSIEIPLLVVKEAHVYKLPGRQSNKGFRAADWDLSKPVFTGQLKVTAKDSKCFVKLFDRQTGQEFAQCPVEAYPGIAVESVLDSSRYFVLRLDDGSGKHAFVGMGFTERSDAFDFNVALRDHFKREEHSQIDEEEKPYVPTHNVGALTGPIKINIKKKGGAEKKPSSSSSQNTGLGLAPPPGGLGASFTPPPQAAPTQAATNPFADASNPFAAPADTNPFGAPPPTTQASADPFGAFASAPAGAGGNSGNDWVKF
eukprot:m.30281 g.30281  ORF g.30281 m.30281 type:complete len:256 (-) comp8190_c0_seq1:2256-3023(-)